MSNSEQQRFKNYLIRDKEWLESLYTSTNTLQAQRLLNFATDAKLDTLIKYLHFLYSISSERWNSTLQSKCKGFVQVLYLGSPISHICLVNQRGISQIQISMHFIPCTNTKISIFLDHHIEVVQPLLM